MRKPYAQSMFKLYYGFIRLRMRSVRNPADVLAHQLESRSPYARAAAVVVQSRAA